ncbi:tetratricopeptide repeat protein [Rhodohalobacter sp. 8-1]|uniref:tetratricopeptide repeat protein n=1 Tax=Rhodohalobacter sp. 8-1 TaxID=3131972 RepID=UPI0030EE32A9
MTEKEISRQITRYINGELSDHEEDQLWIEFLKNPKNYELFETELNLTDLYRNKNFRIDGPDDQNQVNEPNRPYTTWAFSVAAVLLLSAMLYIFSSQTNGEPESFAISEIELTQMLGSDIYRDESPDVVQLDQQINRSLSLALNGDTQQSSEILSDLLTGSITDLQEIRILYNLGILAYNDKRFEKSLNHFSHVIELNTPETPDFIYEKSQWYIANIYLKQRLVDKAVQTLNRLASGSGLHATDAEMVLSRLE